MVEGLIRPKNNQEQFEGYYRPSLDVTKAHKATLVIWARGRLQSATSRFGKHIRRRTGAPGIHESQGNTNKMMYEVSGNPSLH